MPIVRHRFLATEERLHLLRSLVFSKLLFGAEVWQSAGTALCAKLQAFVVRAYRHLLNSRNFRTGDHSTDDQIWAVLSAPDAHDLIRTARLRHLHHVLRDGPHLLRALLDAQSDGKCASWYFLVREDLRWLVTCLPTLQYLGDPEVHWDRWCAAILQHGFGWKGKCKRAMLISAQARTTNAQARLLTLGLGLPDTSSLPVPVQEAGDYVCGDCGKDFATATALAAHRTLQHGATAAVRAYMPDPLTCGSCLKQFGATQKLRQHLQYKHGRCLSHLVEVWSPLTDAQIAEVVTVPLKAARDQYRAPALQTYGPRMPTQEEWLRVAPHRRSVHAARPVLAPCTLTVADCMDWYLAEDFPLSSLMSGCTVRAEVREVFLDMLDNLPLQDRPQWHLSKLREWDTLFLPDTRAPASSCVSPPQSAHETLPPLDPVDALHVLVLHDVDEDAPLEAWWRDISEQYQQPVYPCFLHARAFAASHVASLQERLQPWLARLRGGKLFGVWGILTSRSWAWTGPHQRRSVAHPWGLPTLSGRQAPRVRDDNGAACAWSSLADVAIACSLPCALLALGGGDDRGMQDGPWQFPPLARLCTDGAWSFLRMDVQHGGTDSVRTFGLLHSHMDSVMINWHLVRSRLLDVQTFGVPEESALLTVGRCVWHAFVQIACRGHVRDGCDPNFRGTCL
eukprot:Skav200592  [mRNA]  locus=scaffold2706:44434:46467:+ [translate_table: standard]